MNWWQQHWAFLASTSALIFLYAGFWLGVWTEKKPPREVITITGPNGREIKAEIIEGELW